MISVTGHFDEGFNYEPYNYYEFLAFDCQSILATLELDYEWSNDIDTNLSVDAAAESETGIYTPSYQMREFCIQFFKSEDEAKLIIDDGEPTELMPLKEFKQLSCNAAFQLCTRLLNFLSIEYAIENEIDDYELYDLGKFDTQIEEFDLDIEKASYLAILKSELDRIFLNLLMADNNHTAISQWKSREKLRINQRKGANKTNKIWEGARKFSINQASKIWDTDKHTRIKVVADHIHKLMDSPDICIKNNIKDAPELTTIRKWIKEIAPPEAKKPGRPSLK